MQPNEPLLDLRPLAGSERPPAPTASPAAQPLDPQATVEATLLLRRAVEGAVGADPADLATVTDTLSGLGVQILSADAPSRRVRIAGPASLVGRVFGTDLQQVSSRAPDGRAVSHRHRTGGLSVPAPLDGIVTAVLGLDDRPQARAQLRIAAAAAVSVSYTPPQLAKIYRFPPGTDGSGQSLAIIELGGGFAQSELDTYFAGLGITGPTVTAVGVDGANNQPGQDPQGADGEVLLDIEVAGGLAPGAQLVVYFAPNTDAGFLDAVSEAVHAKPTPAAISISWGLSEDDWTAQARNALDSVFADAVLLGSTVTAAAGDNGSSDGATDGRDHADFPASSPNVLACGGTSLNADPTNGAVSGETVWNNGAQGGATGGGVSDVFAQPTWQATAGVPARQGGGRGVPDVAANADPQTGYQVLVDGAQVVYGGTSAVAPLWAGLIARLAQATGRSFGLLAAELYQGTSTGQAAAGFRDVTSGDNGSFAAGPGWDACTGLGSPDGTALLTLLQRQADAQLAPGLE
ncbi:MAG: kumamolisin [Pseudonocardiales bacterium]|jgi:kumamolisin|nr:peptidase [Pseudonocardiales bacterium]MDT4973596.1 kumamolisin [Pseudonocardiales bacterium]